MTISGAFRCPRPLNRGVRLIKVSSKVNEGNKFWYFGYCPLNKVCLLNPFAPGDFAEKRVLKVLEWFSGHCPAIKS